jgi:uncharacterized protein (TIGR04255 family)
MAKSVKLLPEFLKPPVVEVAVMIQYEAPTLEMVHLLHLWSKVREQFPGFEQAPPIPPAMESFETPRVNLPQVQFQLMNSPPTPRMFFKMAGDTELIQIQQDRFGYSWRKLKTGDAYPRYVNIKESFLKQLAFFQEFLASEKLGALRPILCEVTFVNHIQGGEVWHGHSELHKVIPSVTPKLSKNFLPPPEDMQFSAKYIITEKNDKSPAGRLYVAAEPRFLTADMAPIFLMRLTARGAPRAEGNDGIVRMFDLGHEWIVRAFAALTSPEMHKVWERRQ